MKKSIDLARHEYINDSDVRIVSVAYVEVTYNEQGAIYDMAFDVKDKVGKSGWKVDTKLHKKSTIGFLNVVHKVRPNAFPTLTKESIKTIVQAHIDDSIKN